MERSDNEELTSSVGEIHKAVAASADEPLKAAAQMMDTIPSAGEITTGDSTTNPTISAGPSPVDLQSEPARPFSIEEANEEIAKLLESSKVTQQEVQSLQGLIREHAALKVKVDRLKGLLGRSAKAQRESKIELEATQKRLDQVLRDVKRLTEKVDHLSTRPTHSKLLLAMMQVLAIEIFSNCYGAFD